MKKLLTIITTYMNIQYSPLKLSLRVMQGTFNKKKYLVLIFIWYPFLFHRVLFDTTFFLYSEYLNRLFELSFYEFSISTNSVVQIFLWIYFLFNIFFWIYLFIYVVPSLCSSHCITLCISSFLSPSLSLLSKIIR